MSNKSKAEAFARQIQDIPGLAVRRLALDISNRITAKMPVRTGVAKASTMVTIGTLEAAEHPMALSERLEAGREAATTGVRAPIPQGDIYIRGGEAVAVITNDVHYVEYLNEGSSDQTPEKFIELSIEEAISGA